MQGSAKWALKAVLGFWLLAGATVASVITLQNRKRRKSAVRKRSLCEAWRRPIWLLLTRSSGPQIGVIPARYESGRFPGKPLVGIMGKPMIVRTYLQAKKALSLERLVVATDDERIAAVCQAAGAEVIMTSKDCANGEQIGIS